MSVFASVMLNLVLDGREEGNSWNASSRDVWKGTRSLAGMLGAAAGMAR